MNKKLLPKKLNLVEIERVYRILRPYLDPDYLEICKRVVYNDREAFDIVINILCGISKNGNVRDWSYLVWVFIKGLELNNFNRYVSLMEKLRDGSSKR